MARLSRIWSSTPLRLSILIAALFAAVSLGSFAATYIYVRDNTEQTLRATLDQAMAGFRGMPSQKALVALVRAQSRETNPAERILSYRLGPLHVGNAALIPEGEGYRVIAAGARNIDGDYYALGETLHGGMLTIAANAKSVRNMRDAFAAVFLFSIVPTTLLVIGGGVLLAWRSNRRLSRIEAALDRLTRGDLAARVAAPEGDDDLGRIAGRIDRMALAQEKHVSALRQVSADIAHDLKTPIQRLAMMLHALQARSDLDSAAADLADRAVVETEGIVRTFDLLLQIAQIEGGSPKLRFEPVDLGALARIFCELYAPAAEEGGRSLACEAPPEPVFTQGDKTLLGQVFANLIENGLRHTPPGSRITVRVSQADGAARLEVADDGPGVPEAERENVLRRLYRLEASRATPGSGLGLSMVAAVTALHEGRLTLADNGPGLLARIDLPG